MEETPARSSVALFAALARAVREAPVPELVRDRTFGVVDRLARAAGLGGFELALEALKALAMDEPRLVPVLQPFWTELGTLAAISIVRTSSAPTDR